MTIKTYGKRAVSLLLALLMVIGLVPFSVNSIIASPIVLGGDTVSRVADPSTMDDWANYFGPNVMSTENAGGIWTDKSVFTDASAFPGISMSNSDGFLVALSAIASNLAVEGMSYVPTDTMLILDVSGSMNTNGLSDEMVDAANASISKLLSDNKHNRVGVALYSGSASGNNNSASTVVLPLGRYTTTSAGKYLVHSSQSNTKSIEVSSNVRDENGKEVSGSANVTGATYIQKGVLSAVEEFAAQSGNTVVNDPVLGELQRIPVMVLMSDGAPTLGDTDFTNPGTPDLGDGGSSHAYVGFVTQLTLAYAKEQIKAAYGGDALFYTLGLGVLDDEIATSVLDPSTSNTTINSFWEAYNNAAVGEKITVHSYTEWRNTGSFFRPNYEQVTVICDVTKSSTPISQSYVDEYFPVDTSSGNPEDALIKAFEDIVSKIQLQSSYFPTLVETTEHLSGYISFVDRLGKYMDVVDIKGLIINGNLHTGESFASHFANNVSDLGTASTPTALGNEFFNSVKERLGITNDQARALISLAYQHGQLAYDSSTGEFSNYIAWYSNANGDFLGFWYEGIETMPDPSDPSLTDATRPVYINRSYGFFGDVDETHGVKDTDMMYATIRVREEIATGDQTVAFAVPAALIPTVTYNVSLNENNELIDISVTGATSPIRLVYEAALDSDINEITVKSLATDPEYAANHINEDGDYEFFTNLWDHDLSIAYGTNNTYSYFRPSTENDRYYYTSDSVIYTDQNGTPYTNPSAPSANRTYYRGSKVYVYENGAYATKTVYEEISDISLAKATRNTSSNYWYIPAGTVHSNVENYNTPKTSNNTGTISYSNIPFVDAEHNYYVGATLGNNGRITITPATGIKISKSVETANSDANANTSFDFVITNKSNSSDNNTYKTYHVDANKNISESTVTFSEGTATVSLKDGEKIYISGLTANEIFNIKETETVYYKISSINGSSSAKEIDLAITDRTMSSAEFVNAARGSGNLTISKSINHELGANYVIPSDKTFKFTVTLSGLDLAGKTYTARHSHDTGITDITVGEGGVFTLTLANNESLTIYGLPEGTVATVVEQSPGAGFTPAYFDSGVAGDGVVEIVKDNIVSVIVRNTYTASKVDPVNITVGGTKTLQGRDWRADDEFTFVLQKYNADSSSWIDIATDTVKGSDADKNFTFNDAFANAVYDKAGSYYYRIAEVQGSVTGIIYDHTVHAFRVVVGDKDMDGKLEITEVIAERETVHVSFENNFWVINADFTNVYNIKETSASIDITKLVTNASGSPLVNLSGFTFELYEGDTLVATSAATTTRGFTRLNLTFDETAVGTHTYTLKEVVPSTVPQGWTYSTAVITITANITLDTSVGQLNAVLNVGDSTANTTSSVAVEFTNVYDPADASLTLDVVKTLTGRELKDGEFTFEIRLPDGTVAASGKNDANGNVIFDKPLTFDSIGTFYYTVVETSTDGKGVTTDKSVRRIAVTVVDNGGVLSASYIIENTAESRIVFNNTYTAKDVQYVVSGTKVLEGRDLINDEFTFSLTPSDRNGNISDTAKSLTTHNFNDGSFKFQALNFDAPGTYFYLVAEVEDNLALGVKYDSTKYLIKIIVKDNLEGSLVIDATEIHIIGNGAVDEIIFTNVYVPTPTSSDISGNKEYFKLISGSITNKDFDADAFSFRLYKSDSNWAEVAPVETVSNTADGTFAFSQLKFDKAGVYYYLVKELHGGEIINGVIYDSTVYRIMVTVTDNKLGALSAVTSIYDNADVPKDTVSFSNYYVITDSDNVVISGNKTLDGLTLEEGAFSFELYSSDASSAAISFIETVTNAADGSFTFSALNFDAEGTYYYLIKEKDGGNTINGIKYDAKTYLVKVTITDNGIGKLVASVEGASNISFTNTYSATSVSHTVSGTKELTGRPLINNEFTFTLTPSDANGNVAAGATSLEAFNSASGAFSFADLHFDSEGTYYYLIAEAQGSQSSIKYDTTKYLLKIVVKDDLKGALVIDSAEIHVVGGGTASNIVFKNTYTPASTDTDIAGTKQYKTDISGSLTDKSFAEGTFAFMLYESDALRTEGKLIETVTNAADGSFAFTKLIFNTAGEYYYLIKELHGGQTLNGVIYDSSAWLVKIVVTDNLTGQLGANVSIFDGNDVAKDQITFSNLYSANDTDKIVIVGNKVLNNKDLKEKMFSFEIYNSDKDGKIGSLIETVTNKADGSFAFTELSYSAEGTHYYLIKEQNGGETIKGITYDSKTYLVKITVTDNGSGKLVANVEGDESILFTNTYSAAPTSAVIGGMKKYNKPLTGGEFSFILTDKSTGAIIETVTNAADGSFTFKKLEYTAAGSYTYTVSEVIGFAGGVKYDDTKYTVTVTVTDNGEGTLTATVEGANNIEFINTYNTDDTQISFGGKKTLNGRPLKAGEFKFELKDADSKVIQTVTNAADGSFKFNLDFTAAGTYTYKVSELNNNLVGITYDTNVYTITVTVTDNGDGTLTATVEGANNIEFTNTYDAEDAQISFSGIKELNGRPLEADKFSFEIKDANGKVIETVTNKADGSFAFKAINFSQAGTYTYTISEVKGDLGGITYDETVYEITVTVTDNGEGKLIARSSVSANSLHFTNTYSAAPTSAVIGGMKEYNKPLTGGEFSFILTDKSTGAIIETVTNAADGSFTFKKLEYTAAGSYTYTVSEVIGFAGGVKYDDTKYTVTVTVTDNGEGQLVATLSDGADAIKFTNSYSADSTSVRFRGTKKISGRPLAAGEFSFVLKNALGEVIETVTNNADGNFIFKAINYAEAGTYTYTVNEVKGDLGGITYDETVYEITVTVTDNGEGKLVAKVSGADKIEFTNAYDAADTQISFSGTKELNGRPLKAGEFSFEIKDANGKVIETVTNAADGSFAFTAIEFTAAGTYTYTVNEVKGDLGGITYDETVYKITVTVTDNGEGKLIATSSGANAIKFTNTYAVAETQISFSGKKELNGRPLEAGEFSFILMDASGSIIETVTNAADGSFVFTAIKFSSAGTYIYTVSEQKGNLGGITYDEKLYTVTVTVKDNGDGTLTATAEGADAIKFVNTYSVASCSINLAGKKELKGRPLEAGEFSFILMDASGSIIETVTNAADGSFAFTAITYSTAGTHTYKISELRGSLGGVTYDDKVYTVTVDVEDGKKGVLTATVKGADSIVFTNNYSAQSDDIIFGGIKVLNGRKMTEGEFSFVLKDASGKVIETVTNSASGSFSFSPISYENAGTYNYTVSELKGSLGGITYDETVYEITVTVTDNGEGKLTASVSGAESIIFRNVYEPSTITLNFFGKKILVGRELKAGEFSFILKDQYGDIIDTVTNDKNGDFIFGDIEFEHPGLYYFYVSEVIGTDDGIRYDDSVQRITVTISDDGDGQLRANVGGAHNITFTNYYAAPTEVTLGGSKILDGRDLAEGEFSFELRDSFGNVIETVTNKADGSFSFSAIEYENEGTYTYTVNEVIGDDKNIIYDSNAYFITVKVEDNGKGALVATVSGASAISFVNTFVPEETTEVPDDTTEVPDDTTEVPDDTTEVPDDTTEVPDDTTEVPDDTTEVPDDTTEVPDDTTEVPDDTTEVPDDTTEVPDDTTEVPDDTTQDPDDTTEPPSPGTGDKAANKIWIGAAIIILIATSVHLLGKKRETEENN